MRRQTRIVHVAIAAVTLIASGASLSARPAPPPASPQGTQPPARSLPAAPATPPTAGRQPDAIHLLMARRAGEYTIAKKIQIPGRPPMETTGHATITSVLGGRFLREENDGMLFGSPVATSLLSGYDDDAGRFEEVWGWTGSNRLFWATGKSDDGGKTVHYTSTYDSGKGKTERIEIDFRVIDDDRFAVTFVEKKPDGSDGLTMEAAYSRTR